MRPLAAFVVLAALLGGVPPPVAHAEAGSVELGGTLAKVRKTGSITLGYREDAVPFSYLSASGEPIGYSIDLCKLLVAAIGDRVGRPPAIRWFPVTARTRIAAVADGQVDIECGSTTSSVERRKLVAFSPVIFLAGTRLLVRRGSGIRSFRDLAGRRLVVTAGTTNQAAIDELVRRFDLPVLLATAPDHAQSFDHFARGRADAFATDDVLLHALVAQSRRQAEFEVVGEFLSYEPYSLMFRKGDEPFAELVADTFRQLAANGEIERRYERWFLRRLPQSDVSLDLPMSRELEVLLRLQSPPR